jgi:Zn-dependent M28 family amino/carboxypeptidase
MNRSVAGAIVGGFVLALGTMPAGVSARQDSGFKDAIAAIAAGEDSAARGRAIIDTLERAGIDVHREDFSFPQFTGANIVATIPAAGATKTLLLGAHYDRTPKGTGAVDNAASCVVIERLLADLKKTPLAHYAVTAVFFDLEERGLIGSQGYFARHQGEKLPDAAINFDIFGYGDTLFVDASSPDGPLLASLQDAATDSPIHVRAISSMKDYPASDHRIMMSAGIDTLGVALIDGTEIDAVLQHDGPPPRIATIIHTPEDTIDKVRPDDMERAFPVIEKTIRLMDGRD